MPRLTGVAIASNYQASADWCNGCGLYAYVNAGEHRADCTRDRRDAEEQKGIAYAH